MEGLQKSKAGIDTTYWEGEFNDREIALIKNWISSGMKMSKANRTRCAVMAGYKRSNALSTFGMVIKKLSQNEKMTLALESQGVTMIKLAEKIAELIDAEHPQFKGRPDNFAQLKAFGHAAKILDVNPSLKLDINRTERRELRLSADILHRIEKVKGDEAGAIEAEIVRD